MMNLVSNYYSKAQDVFSDTTKDRLVNVYRNQSGRTGGAMANSHNREKQVQQGQEDFLDISSLTDRKAAVEGEDIHFRQQQALKNLFRNP